MEINGKNVYQVRCGGCNLKGIKDSVIPDTEILLCEICSRVYDMAQKGLEVPENGKLVRIEDYQTSGKDDLNDA